jgi:hypothetical protein
VGASVSGGEREEKNSKEKRRILLSNNSQMSIKSVKLTGDWNRNLKNGDR